MIGDLFWDIATSDLAMAIVASLGAAGFAVSLLSGVARFVEPLKPYVLLARLVRAGSVASLIFLAGFRVADERADLRDAKATIAKQEKELRVADEIGKVAAREANDNRMRADALQAEVDDYVLELHRIPEPAVCIATPADHERLRRIFDSAKARRADQSRLRKSGAGNRHGAPVARPEADARRRSGAARESEQQHRRDARVPAGAARGIG